MKIALVTTLPVLIENKRIKEEVLALGHEFFLINLEDFNFKIKGGKLSVPALDNADLDLIIVRGIFSSIKSISAVLESLKKKGVKIFDNNFLKHQYLINKVADLTKLVLGGIPIPETQHVRDFNNYPKVAKELGYPVIIKSTRMGKGANVFKMDNEGELLAFLESCEEEGKEPKNYILQEFIPYKYDLRVLVLGDRIFTMRRIPAKGEFRANFSLGGDVELFDLDEKGKELALAAMDAVDMSVGGVDILITKDDKRYILEVNHTVGFVGMEKATGENIGKVFVEHAIANAK